MLEMGCILYRDTEPTKFPIVVFKKVFQCISLYRFETTPSFAALIIRHMVKRAWVSLKDKYSKYFPLRSVLPSKLDS